MSELRGIGLDICGIDRMAQQLDNTHFLQRILTKEEIAYLRSRGASAADTLAGLYAAKEAIVKALGCGIAFPLTEIAISHTAQGQPTAVLSGEAALRYPGHQHSIWNEGKPAHAMIGVGRRFFILVEKAAWGRVCGRAKLLRRDASLPATKLPYCPFLLE